MSNTNNNFFSVSSRASYTSDPVSARSRIYKNKNNASVRSNASRRTSNWVRDVNVTDIPANDTQFRIYNTPRYKFYVEEMGMTPNQAISRLQKEMQRNRGLWFKKKQMAAKAATMAAKAATMAGIRRTGRGIARASTAPGAALRWTRDQIQTGRRMYQFKKAQKEDKKLLNEIVRRNVDLAQLKSKKQNANANVKKAKNNVEKKVEQLAIALRTKRGRDAIKKIYLSHNQSYLNARQRQSAIQQHIEQLTKHISNIERRSKML